MPTVFRPGGSTGEKRFSTLPTQFRPAPAGGRGFGKQAPFQPRNRGAGRGRGHGAALSPDAECVRAAVMALRRAPDASGASQAAGNLQSALVAAEASNTKVDGALIGMAAAQASRMVLRETLDCLCAFAWSRLGQYGGREVAELASAAVKHNCGDNKLFHFVGNFCKDSPGAFGCTRDVALMAATLLKKSGSDHHGHGREGGGPRLDGTAAFRGLVAAALPHLNSGGSQSVCIRDVAEFLYALTHMLDHKVMDGEQPLHQDRSVIDAIQVSVSIARRSLHVATPQDIAKLTGAVAVAWPLLASLRETVLQPFIGDLSQAIRFRGQDFNAKDVGAIVVALAKLDVSNEMLGEVLVNQVETHISKFTDKDLSLLLWACSRQGWANRKFSKIAIMELHQRELSRLLVVDLCMLVQALAKLGPSAKATLCLLAGEAFNRQLHGFSTSDKALLLWSLAKSRVIHMALCKLLIRSLATECCSSMQRDVLNATLWALASVYPSLSADDRPEEWSRMLTQLLCSMHPWRGCLPFEVTNAAWAFGQLPAEWTTDFWPSLLSSAEVLKPGERSLHELCNLLSGVALCPRSLPAAAELTEALLDEVLARVRGECRASGRDKRSVQSMLGSLEEQGPLPARFEELATLVLGSVGDGSHSAAHDSPNSTAAADKAAGCAAHSRADCDARLHQPHAAVAVHGEHDHSLHEHYDLPNSPDALKVNPNCDFRGHCVQLRNTFIHVDCDEDQEEGTEGCDLCERGSRPRARSADNLRGTAEPDCTPPASSVEPDCTPPDSSVSTASEPRRPRGVWL